MLALAIVGALALALYTRALAGHTAALGLSPSTQAQLLRGTQLGAATLPAELLPAQAAAARQAIRQAFVDTFRVVMLVCAALAWLSAGMAAVFVRGPAVAVE